ncbi:hypothetical protein [Clostridium pascui]
MTELRDQNWSKPMKSLLTEIKKK